MTFKILILIEAFMFCALLLLGGANITQTDKPIVSDTIKPFTPDTIEDLTNDVKFDYFIQGLLGEKLPDTSNK